MKTQAIARVVRFADGDLRRRVNEKLNAICLANEFAGGSLVSPTGSVLGLGFHEKLALIDLGSSVYAQKGVGDVSRIQRTLVPTVKLSVALDYANPALRDTNCRLIPF